MNISTNISGATLKIFDDSILSHRKDLLKRIWTDFLKDTIDFDQFVVSLLTRPKNIKQIRSEYIDVEPNLELCRARIWNHINKNYSQCKFHPSVIVNENMYCEKHKEKRNYGDF